MSLLPFPPSWLGLHRLSSQTDTGRTQWTFRRSWNPRWLTSGWRWRWKDSPNSAPFLLVNVALHPAWVRRARICWGLSPIPDPPAPAGSDEPHAPSLLSHSPASPILSCPPPWDTAPHTHTHTHHNPIRHPVNLHLFKLKFCNFRKFLTNNLKKWGHASITDTAFKVYQL